MIKTHLNLAELSFQDKLEMIDSVWEDIRRHPNRLDSTSWHQDVLQERSTLLAERKENVLDWKNAHALLD